MSPVYSGLPPAGTPVPDAVLSLAGASAPEPVWRNEVGGLTYRLSDGRFVKWSLRTAGIDLHREADRLAWASPFTPVPRVLALEEDADATWLVTAALPGGNAVAERWKADPAPAVAAIGAGLRALHEALPVDGCPFGWSVADRLPAAHERAAAGEAGRPDLHPDFAHLGWDDVLRVLADVPEVDVPVVCHGDACAPNTLLDDAGRWSGHVDLGSLGVADRWADLAVAAWSTTWNYGPGWTDHLLAAYGVAADPDRMAWYRLLWDAT